MSRTSGSTVPHERCPECGARALRRVGSTRPRRRRPNGSPSTAEGVRCDACGAVVVSDAPREYER